MRIKLKIRQKIFFIILSVSIVLYGIAIGYIVNSSQKAMLDDALQNAKLTARISADVIEKEFERDLALTRTLTQAFSIYQELPTDLWQDLFMRMYYPVLEGNEHVYSIWDSWEYYGFVPNYDKDHGRFCMTVWREDGGLSHVTDNRSLKVDPDKYGGFKQKNQEGLWEPYFDEVVKGKADRVLMTTVASPIQIDGRYMGLIGLDISLESLQEVVADIEPVPGSYAFLVSEKGVVAAHHDPELINTPLKKIIPDDYEQENLGDIVKEGLEHSYFRTDADGVEHYVCYAPIRAGNSYSSWSLALSIPLDVITQRADENLRISLIVGIAGLFVLALVLMFVANSLTRPITKITRSLRRLRYGEISDDLTLNLRTGDEIETMSNALNISIEGLNQKTTFANDIGKGELESQLELLGDKDELGQALMNMRNSLKRAKEDEEKRAIEDKKRAWANEGFAKFAEILRTNNDNLQQLSDEVIQKLVKYLDGNQGALFLINDDDKKNVTLEAASVYAWDRKKFVDKQIMLGEGLVGACALERETIFLTEIPENFVTITSGLGEANPNCILLVPLKQDDNVLGVIEIASFKVFEKFEVVFLEKVAESIAATIATAKINDKTKELLEQSQQQAEEMQAQEEEMRQNMEELLATQEEMGRKEKEMAWTMDAIGGVALHLEYDFKGVITHVNSMVCKLTGYAKDELVGQHHSILFDNKDIHNSVAYSKFWDDMNKHKPFEGIMRRLTKQNNHLVVKGLCHPVFDEDGKPIKVVEIAVDVSDLVKE